ncbi:hypothetical protein [Zoogloea dura]|uniref:Uncharacterized protein n=1 Tax=Zoogloea dura TaxID=2728840 RepID=A0A848G8R4_9RHOO|nr:hypothetical protein [Zoogloea dura]NML28678.1 hypothetical protein [Zoogloea dura]
MENLVDQSEWEKRGIGWDECCVRTSLSTGQAGAKVMLGLRVKGKQKGRGLMNRGLGEN